MPVPRHTAAAFTITGKFKVGCHLEQFVVIGWILFVSL